jgi:hypothetical protein
MKTTVGKILALTLSMPLLALAGCIVAPAPYYYYRPYSYPAYPYDYPYYYRSYRYAPEYYDHGPYYR